MKLEEAGRNFIEATACLFMNEDFESMMLLLNDCVAELTLVRKVLKPYDLLSIMYQTFSVTMKQPNLISKIMSYLVLISQVMTRLHMVSHSGQLWLIVKLNPHWYHQLCDVFKVRLQYKYYA